MGSRLIELISEAKRRRVFRTTGVYLVGIWAISQGAVELAPLFEVPNWILRTLLVGGIAFTPAVVILAWMFDIRMSGIVRDPQDVAEAQEGEQDLAHAPTQLGGGSERGAVAVHWTDEQGERRVLLTEDFFIGRAQDCRVRFYDPLVSRKHAKVVHADGSWRLQDLGSRNGTIVDGERVDSILLGPRTRVRVNEAGPVLSLDLIASGEETTVALSDSIDSARVAHVWTETMQAGKIAATRRTGA